MAVLRPSLEYGCEMWNTNKCQAKALESIQLHANRRDFLKLKWYCKFMSMKDEILPFKSLPNEWDKVKCKGHPRISWLAQVEFLKKELGLQDQVLDIKIIKKKNLDKRECEGFEMTLQHKSKIRVYRELKSV